MDRLLDLFFYITFLALEFVFSQWWWWVFLACVGWALIGVRLRGSPLPDPRSRLIFLGPFCVPLAPWTVIALTFFTFSVILGVQWLLDPKNFLLTLPIIAIVWFFFISVHPRLKRRLPKRCSRGC
jgi:hypothetical protein